MTEFWFTSDTHYNHENILEFQQNRSHFKDIQEMTDIIIENWNKHIKNGDVVYHLGDFALTYRASDTAIIEDILNRKNGNIHLILGNHDRKWLTRANGFETIKDVQYKKINDQKIFMFHYPVLSWRAMHHESWHIFGHSHGNLKFDLGKAMDVGIDTHPEFRPYHFDEIKEILDKKEVILRDHH